MGSDARPWPRDDSSWDYKQAQLHRKRLSMSVATEVSDTADAESSNANPFRGKHGVAYGHFRPAELELLHKDHE